MLTYFLMALAVLYLFMSGLLYMGFLSACPIIILMPHFILALSSHGFT